MSKGGKIPAVDDHQYDWYYRNFRRLSLYADITIIKIKKHYVTTDEAGKGCRKYDKNNGACFRKIKRLGCKRRRTYIRRPTTSEKYRTGGGNSVAVKAISDGTLVKNTAVNHKINVNEGVVISQNYRYG